MTDEREGSESPELLSRPKAAGAYKTLTRRSWRSTSRTARRVGVILPVMPKSGS